MLSSALAPLLQNALHGCVVDVGLYSDSSNKVLEFYVNKTYSRTVYRGESGCFVSMDKKEIVVEVWSIMWLSVLKERRLQVFFLSGTDQPTSLILLCC